MTFSNADVVKLRKATGAGMMDCKNALTQADGDFEGAVQIIRERGKLVASKRADREATEGVVLAKVTPDKKFGAMLVLNCETDFVAKNERFIAFTESILDQAIKNRCKSQDELTNLNIEDRPVGVHITEQIGIIGEKLELSYYDNLEAEHVVAYIHPGNRLATLAGFNKPEVDNQVAKDIAMQVAAMAPVSVDKDAIPPDMIEKELAIAKERFRQEGRPEAMLDKIAQGALNKWFSEVTLLNQTYVKDGKISIREFLSRNDKELSVKGFIRYSLNL